MNKKMEICFLLPFLNRTGGILSVFQLATYMKKSGKKIVLIYPIFPFIALTGFNEKDNLFNKFIKGFLNIGIRNMFNIKYSIYYRSETLSVQPILFYSQFFMKKSNCYIATAWPISNFMKRIKKNNVLKISYIQGYENWFGYYRQFNSSLRVSFPKIVISKWLETKLLDKGVPNINFISQGIDLTRYFPPENKNWKKPKILMIYQLAKLKGGEDYNKLVQSIIQHYPNISITMFGLPKFQILNNKINYYSNLEEPQIIKLYQNSNIFVNLSHNEGWGFPVAEAMACKNAVITTNVGFVPEVYNGRNLLLCQIGDSNSAFEKIKYLISNFDKAEYIAEAGHKSIQNYSFEKTASKFLRFLDKNLCF